MIKETFASRRADAGKMLILRTHENDNRFKTGLSLASFLFALKTSSGYQPERGENVFRCKSNRTESEVD